jgi:hypothetical protein
LAEKLRAARSEQEKLEDNYRAELRAQTKLVDLYRQHGEENTAKTDELSRALTDLQQLLKGTVPQDLVFFFSVLRIHGILVWIRIRGSMPLTN